MSTRKEALALMRSFVGKRRNAMPWLKGRPKMYDCAAGYSYCATGKVQKYVWVHEMVNLMKANGTWKVGHPQPGDAIIYDWNGDGGCDHVAMFHSVDSSGRWVAFGADQGHPSPGLVSKLVTGKGVILGWGTPFHYDPEPEVPPVLPSETTTTRHEMDLKPEHYPPVVVTPAVTTVTPTVEPVVAPASPTQPAFPGNLQVGSHGEYVKHVQAKLGITADGVFGPHTKAAVIEFQKKHGLDAQGIVGLKTWEAIG